MKKEKAGLGTWTRMLLLAVLLALAAGLVFFQNESQTHVPPPTPSPAAVPEQSNRRYTREEAYDKDIAVLQTLADSGDEFAVQQLQNMIGMHQSELAIEEALMNSGFEDALVIAQGNSVTVMLPAEKITEENSARILALCMSYADVRAENIRIMDY